MDGIRVGHLTVLKILDIHGALITAVFSDYLYIFVNLKLQLTAKKIVGQIV